MAPVARPENVLKRAEELVSMEKPTDALDLLYETVLSKRTRSVSLEFLEPIVLRFIELAVQLRKGKIVKDGLYQYKKLTLSTSVSSLQVVVDRLLELSESKVNLAQDKADAIVEADEDLEAEQSPQDVLMATVSSEQTKDRADREVVTPWLKFLWENYRSILDVLRNNAKLEDMYARVVSKAFQFCLDYKRKTEFRRLCELLRNHLQYAATQNSGKNQNQAPGSTPINLSDPDTLQKFLDTRFAQLDVAVKLELWQEAFRSVEDVHTLLTVSRRPISIGYMATYYETLASIFSVSGNHLFHAAAWAKYYSMAYHTRHSAPAGYLEKIASFFLLSWLCIPVGAGEPEVSSRSHRWAALLNLTRLPSSSSMIQGAMAKNVLSYARPEIRDLYLLLETSQFHPLTLKHDLSTIAGEMAGRAKVYGPYMKPLFSVLANRVFTELAEVYTEVDLDFVIDLAVLPAPFEATPQQIERLLVQGSNAGKNFHVHLDYQSRSVKFVDTVQDLVSTDIADLAAVLATVDPVSALKREELRHRIEENAKSGLAAENQETIARRQLQAQRDKKAAAEQQIAEQIAAKERTQKLAEQQAAEAQRIANEAREREIKRMAQDRAEAERDFKRKIAEDINAKGVMRVDMEQLDSLSQKQLHNMQLKQLDRESRGLRERMRAVSRRYDHLERAYRREEANAWREDAKNQEIADRETWEKRKTAIIESSKARHAQAQEYKRRFTHMLPSYNSFMKEARLRHEAQVNKKREENAARLAEAKKALLAEFEQRRKKEAEEAAAREERRLAEEAAREAAAEKRAKEEEERKARFSATLDLRSSSPATGSPFPERVPSGSPFGNARPRADAQPPRSSPFGNARPRAEDQTPRSSPFGNARPRAEDQTPRSSPFGNARPRTEDQTPKSNPFGNARPRVESRVPSATSATPPPAPPAMDSPANRSRDSIKRSPFGNAKPVETKTSNQKSDEKPPSRGKFIPSHLRK